MSDDLRKSSSYYGPAGLKSKAPSYYSRFHETDAKALRMSSSQYFTPSKQQLEQEQAWEAVIGQAAYFRGRDPVLGHVLAVMYKSEETQKLCCLVISKHGQTFVKDANLSESSVYYPAVLNLKSEELKQSKVRRCLAVSFLKTVSQLDRETMKALLRQAQISVEFDWDETMAGALASRMQLLTKRVPLELGQYLMSLGFFPSARVNEFDSHLVDVVYHSDVTSDEMTDRNNMLAYLLGDQLEHLFDPLMEYSPEPTENGYKPPVEAPDTLVPVAGKDDSLVQSICAELVKFQTNFTVSLVEFLKTFVVPLRVQALDAKIEGFSTSRMNEVFPPTLDEVTRINCIFLDMLKAAQPYGSFELLKACGTTIPYFYKACMRHEAATKKFAEGYEQMVADLKAQGKEELLTYDLAETRTLMCSSSLNLVKIQLILERLMRSKDWSHAEADANALFNSCKDTIVSFANDKLKPYNHRIFTPTGKILTELASSWPTELQYGWLNRRVVAVFDVDDMLSAGVKNRGAIIVFSDHLLVLQIDDDEYYYSMWEEQNSHGPSIADILMHSLVNEVPVTGLPHLTVRDWCRIDHVHAFHHNHGEDSYVRLLTSTFAGEYRVEKYSGQYVADVISKAQILNKSQAFHLFRKATASTTLYYTAHELNSYRVEDVRSPILVAFNMNARREVLQRYQLFAIVTLNFVDSDHIRMEGLALTAPHTFAEVVPVGELTQRLGDKVAALWQAFMTVQNPLLRDWILSGNGFITFRAAEIMGGSDSHDEAERTKTTRLVEQLRLERTVTQGVRDDVQSRTGTLEMLVDDTASRKSKLRNGISKIFRKHKEEEKAAELTRKIEVLRPTGPVKRVKLAKEQTPDQIINRQMKLLEQMSPAAAKVVGDVESELSEKPAVELTETLTETLPAPILAPDSESESDSSVTSSQISKLDVSIVPSRSSDESINLPTTHPTVIRHPIAAQLPSISLRQNKPSYSRMHRVDSFIHIHQKLLGGTAEEAEQEVAKRRSRNELKVFDPLLPHSESYYDKFRQARNTQEQAVQDKGIALVTYAEKSPVLSEHNIVYSPSTRMKLTQLATTYHQKEGPNWVKFSSRDNTESGTLSALASGSSETIKAAEPATPKAAAAVATIDATIDADAFNTRASIKSVDFDASRVPTMPHKPSKLRVDTPTSVESTDKYYDSLQFVQGASSDGTTRRHSSSGDVMTLGTPMWSEVGINTILDGSNVADAAPAAPAGMSTSVSEEQLRREIEEAGYYFSSRSYEDEEAVKQEDSKKANQTSLCSALEDLKNTPQADILVGLAEGSLLPSDEASAQTLCDLISDDSFQYLGEILAGNISIGGMAVSESHRSLSRMYSKALRERSLRQISEMKAPGETALSVN